MKANKPETRLSVDLYIFTTSLKEVMFSESLACFSVTNITQNVMSRSQ